MNALLVYPESDDTFWILRRILKFVDKKAAFTPLGLLVIAAMLPKSWAVKLVDMNIKKLRDKDIKWADYVVIGGMVTQGRSAKDVIARCKKFGRKVIFGGPILDAGLDEFPGVDHFFVGEAVEIFPADTYQSPSPCLRKKHRLRFLLVCRQVSLC